MTITGGCRCGAVRYRIEAEPLFTRHCWCRDCQYISAGAGTVNVFFPSEAVTVEGALADYASKAESGNQMHRHFCAACGTPVFTQSEARRQYIGVRAGTLDDPELGKPQMAIWTSSAPSWAAFDPTIPQERSNPHRPSRKGDEELAAPLQGSADTSGGAAEQSSGLRRRVRRASPSRARAR